MPDLLRPVATVQVHAIPRFTADDFELDEEICPIYRDIKEGWEGKVEENVPACTLAAALVCEDVKDAKILSELGERAEISLAHLFELLCRQPNGEAGFLFGDGRLNYAYIRDAGGALNCVQLSWDEIERGWVIRAGPLDDRLGLLAGWQVIARTEQTSAGVVAALDLLEPIGTFDAPAVRRFVAGHVAWGLHVFTKQFVGKIEEDTPAATLTVSQLRRDAPGTLLLELGERAEIALTHLYELVSRQPRGEAGVLATDGHATAFHVRDTGGRLRRVTARWGGADGWLVDTSGLRVPLDGQAAGDRVVSR